MGGNTRRGPARGVSGRPGTLPWDRDDEILERMERVRILRNQRKSARAIAVELGISQDVVYDDLNRCIELRAKRAIDATEEYIQDLDGLITRLHEELDGADRRSINRGAILGQLRQAYKDRAEALGVFKTKLELTGKDGGPIEVADAVRERLAGRIAELAARGEAQPTSGRSD